MDVVESITIMDVCPLYKFCRSPSRSETWCCLKGDDTRVKSCVVYIGFMRGNPDIIEWLAPNGQKRKK